MIKAKDTAESEAFTGCDSKLKQDVVEFINNYDEMFQEPEGFPPKRGIQHWIHFTAEYTTSKCWHVHNVIFGE